MTTTSPRENQLEQHWNRIYQQDPGHTGSWFQQEPDCSLRLLDETGVHAGRSVVDVGAGESRVLDRLLRRGLTDLTALDVSATALRTTQQRLGEAASAVEWIVQDIRAWHPQRRYDVWHDRAVFHFLTTEASRAEYLGVLDSALAPGGHVVIGTFAADGPEACSGLPVARYTPEQLAAQFDERFRVRTTRRTDHHTPAGTVQPFTWVVLGRA